MPNYVDPATFEGHPLILKRKAKDDYSVLICNMAAGRIMAQPRAGRGAVWFWTMTGPYLPDQLRPSNGEADTLDEAKNAFRDKFDKWLSWAAALQQLVVWNVGVERR